MKNISTKFYRAVSLDDLARYRSEGGAIPEHRPWAGYVDPSRNFGRRVINHVTRWVVEGRGPSREYDVLLSVVKPLSLFEQQLGLNDDSVYKNKVSIPLYDVRVEAVSPRVVLHDVEELELSDKVKNDFI